VADTAPLIFRLEGGGDPRLVRACSPLFDLVDDGELGCLVSTISAAEFFAGAHRRGAAAVAVFDAFLRSPAVGVVPPDVETASTAGKLLARRHLRRLGDAVIAATALDLGLPLVTADRRLARARAVKTFLLADFA
jgi:predicted nucleic acid-binding protein